MRLKLDEKRQRQYDDPGPQRDRLYQDDYPHQSTVHDDCEEYYDADCTISGDERGDRASRKRDEPFVHFGNIASSSQLQVSTLERIKTHLGHEATCFEMEATGVFKGAFMSGGSWHLRIRRFLQ